MCIGRGHIEGAMRIWNILIAPSHITACSTVLSTLNRQQIFILISGHFNLRPRLIRLSRTVWCLTKQVLYPVKMCFLILMSNYWGRIHGWLWLDVRSLWSHYVIESSNRKQYASILNYFVVKLRRRAAKRNTCWRRTSVKHIKTYKHIRLLTWQWWCFWSSAAVSPCWGNVWSPPRWDGRLHLNCLLSAPRCWCWWPGSGSWSVPRSDLRGSSYLKTEDRQEAGGAKEKKDGLNVCWCSSLGPNNSLF